MRFTLSSRSARRGVALFAVMALFVPVVGLAAEEGGESPEAVVEGLKAAAEAEDFPAMMRLLAPEARTEVTLGMVMGVSMMIAFAQMGTAMGGAMGEALTDEEDPEAQAELEKAKAEADAETAKLQARLEEVFVKHGLDEAMSDESTEEDPEAMAAMLEGVDQPALVGDLVDIMKDFDDEGGQMSGPPVGELEDLVIDGDRAKGTVAGEPAEFVRIDGRWFFSPPGLDG
jgi:hypothetical protein